MSAEQIAGPPDGTPRLVAAPVERYVATGRFRPRLVALLQAVFGVVFRGLFAMRVSGRSNVPRAGAVILAGNHTGFLDGPLVWLYAGRPARFLTKAELYRYPLLARALGWLGQIPVHRGSADRAAVRAALAELAAGGAVGVFPEGARSSGDLSSVQPGVAYLAVKSGAPVVPVASIGSARALPRGARMVRPRVPIVVAYGAPFTPAVPAGASTREGVAAAAEQIRARLVAHLAATQAAARDPSGRGRP
jgi:1-acyl-sn-glycerol-3-phosphate acyltransferase